MKPKKMPRETDAISAKLGSGNVFRDLGVKNPEEALMKAQIALVIGKLIRQLDLNQAQAAAKLGIDQPKISMLLRGRLKDFSIMRLFRFLHALEQDIKIVVHPHAKGGRRKDAEKVEVELLSA